MFKDKIIDELDVLRKHELSQKQIYKARAYARVISQIKVIPHVNTMDDMDGIKGIGDHIRAKIAEILATGTLAAAAKIRKDNSPAALDAIDKVQLVYGIGPARARELVSTHGIRTLDDLRARQDELLNDKQKIGLKHAEDIAMRIPRKEMESHNTKILKMCASVSPNIHMQMVGSFRRGAKTSGDIDILITVPHLPSDGPALFAALCDLMKGKHYVTDVLAQGPKKFMGIVRLTSRSKARRIDMLLTPPEELPYALLYFTGCDKFNVAMRKHALERGYSLSEHGLKRVKEDVPEPPKMSDERDIFTFLGYRYVVPEGRNEKNL